MKNIINEKYRNNFNFEKFKELKTPGKQLDYLENSGLIKLGEGFSRAVFALSSKKVIKASKSSAGTKQTKNEIKVTQKMGTTFLPKIYEYDDIKYYWLTAETVRPMTKKEYTDYFGVYSPNSFPYLIGMYEIGRVGDELKRLYYDTGKKGPLGSNWELASQRVIEIFDFAQQAGLHVREFVWDNMGIAADGRVVLLDAGFDKDDTGY